MSAVVAGPHGHWYAWHDGELLALPQLRRERSAPGHPSVENYHAWYEPTDLRGAARAGVLDALGVQHDLEP